MGGTINLPGQSFSFTTLGRARTIRDACSTAGVGRASTVTGSMTWNGGSDHGLRVVEHRQRGDAVIGGYQNAETLDGVVLDNAGTATMASDAIRTLRPIGLALANGAGIDNQATGTFSFPTNYSLRDLRCVDHQRRLGDLLQQRGDLDPAGGQPPGRRSSSRPSPRRLSARPWCKREG